MIILKKKKQKAPCDLNPCSHGGQCSNINFYPYFSCKCENGYRGSTCDTGRCLD